MAIDKATLAKMQLEGKVVVKELPKKGNTSLESFNIYLLNTTLFFPCVHKPKKKHQSDEMEYCATVFVDEETKDHLFDNLYMNKKFFLVGKDKTEKPPRRIKFPLESQLTEKEKVGYDSVDGLYGFSVTKPAISRQGNHTYITVKDKDNNDVTENVGNGSKCHLKLFAYRNKEKSEQLNVTLDTVVVVDLVPYAGKDGGDSGGAYDDVLGVTYTKREPTKETPKQNSGSTVNEYLVPTAAQDEFDESIPF